VFVDGEATPAQRRAAADLVRESPEARRFLQALQQDADQLKALPRATLPENFGEAVLEQIRLREAQRPAAAFAIPLRRRHSWVPRRAAAAAVLLAIGPATYFFVVYNAKLDPARHLASSQPVRTPLPFDKPALANAPPKKEGAADRVAPDAEGHTTAAATTD